MTGLAVDRAPAASADLPRAGVPTSPPLTGASALRAGLHAVMAADASVHVLGEDIVDPYGGAFGLTAGLSTAWPDRVRSTPISEGALVGIGVGMALSGLRPVVEIMFGDFVTLTVDQLVNAAAKMRVMYGRLLPVPLVVRTPSGGRRGYGPTHSQSLESMLLGVPHLDVLAPSPFGHPGELLAAAVASDRPVLFAEHKLLYPAPVLLDGDAVLSVERGPTADAPSVVRNHRGGTPDVTAVAYGGVSLVVAEALRRLAGEEIFVDLVVAHRLSEVPLSELTASLARTGRLLVVDEAPAPSAWSTGVAAEVSARCFEILRSPVARLGARRSILPAARHLEDAVLPTVADVEAALLDLL